MLTAVVSDLHLGTRMSALSTPPVLERLLHCLAEADQVVLLGDLLSLREAALPDALAAGAPFLDGLREAARGKRVVVVPGNHDHPLAEPVLRARLEGARPGLGLEQVVDRPSDGAAGELARRLEGAELAVAYPGLWIRPDVYATHGHYADCHLTVPRPEAVLAALGAVALGRVPERGAEPRHYEDVLAPLYGFANAYAQGRAARGRTSHGGGPLAWVQRYGWGRVTGVRAARIPAAAAAGIAAPAVLFAANRAGLGPFRMDLSPRTIERAVIRAGLELVDRLAIDARHVILGHTHRAGPLPSEPDWVAANGARLLNCGSWVYEAALAERPDGAGWLPGHCVLVRDEDAPELRSLLAEDACTSSA